MPFGVASVQHVKLPINFKIQCTCHCMGMVYILMTAVSLNLISRTTPLLTWYFQSCIDISFIEDLQWRSQNMKSYAHQREPTGSSSDLVQLRPFSKWELLSKESICSQRERFLSLKSCSIESNNSYTTKSPLILEKCHTICISTALSSLCRDMFYH